MPCFVLPILLLACLNVIFNGFISSVGGGGGGGGEREAFFCFEFCG